MGERCGVPLVAMLGRVHLYEGRTPDEIVLPIRTLIRMGVKAVVITAAAGLVNAAIPIGSLVVISDHINLLLGKNALIGSNDDRFGPRFVDMSEVYSRSYRALALEAARDLGIRLVEGIYLIHPGPTLRDSGGSALHPEPRVSTWSACLPCPRPSSPVMRVFRFWPSVPARPMSPASRQES